MQHFSFQKKDMVEMIGAGQLTPDRLRGLAAHYTEKRGEIERRSAADLVRAGFQLRRLNVARSKIHVRRPKPVSDYVVAANALRDARIEIPNETTFTFCQNIVRLDTGSAPFADVPEMRGELQRVQIELVAVAAELERLKSELGALRADRERLQSNVVSLTADQERLKSELGALREDRERLQSDVISLTAGRDRLQSDLVAVTTDREHLKSALGALTTDRERLHSDAVSLTADRECLKSEVEALTVEKERAELDRQRLRAEVHSLLASRSWRITAPFRAISRMLFWRPSQSRITASRRDSPPKTVVR